MPSSLCPHPLLQTSQTLLVSDAPGILPASAHLVLLTPHEADTMGTALSRWGWAAERWRSLPSVTQHSQHSQKQDLPWAIWLLTSRPPTLPGSPPLPWTDEHG